MYDIKFANSQQELRKDVFGMPVDLDFTKRTASFNLCPKGHDDMLKASGRADMRAIDEQVLRVTKEIVTKFIEVGRVSPASFDETFKSIYRSVKEAVLEHGLEEETEE
ncbi:MAG: hypothetical protein HWN68_11420 [Desulfobacterales bacterium]|nr:hypothetical protein [Desulfobacterales bacterium]